MNCGTFGPTPTPVATEAARLARLIESQGAFHPQTRQEIEFEGFERFRDSISSYIAASSDEVALTRNVSDGINIVASGFDWQPGDEVIITDEEHPSGSLPFMNLARRYGAVVKMVPFHTDPGTLIQDLEILVNDRTKLVFMSHVSTVDGARLPAKEASDFLKQKNVPFMLDGAHAIGQFSVDVKDLGCDFYAGCCHKWLLAQQGTGFLYVDNEWIDRLEATWVGWGMTDEYDLEGLNYTPLSSARRFEYGTRNWATHVTALKAMEFHNSLGPANIYSRSHDLAERLKRRLTDIPGIEVITPMERDKTTGIVALSTQGLGHPSPGDWLWENQRILTAHNPGKQTMRLAAAFFLLEEEIDLLADCFSELSKNNKLGLQR